MESGPRRGHPLTAVSSSFTRVSTRRAAALGLALGLLAGAPAALAEEARESSTEEKPAAHPPADAPLAAGQQREHDHEDKPTGSGRLPGMSGVPAPQPSPTRLSATGWAAHGALTLVPVAGVYGASQIHDERLWKTSVEVGGGLAGAYLPGRLLFLRVSPEGRATELEEAAFGVGLVLTPPLAALGTWGVGEVAFHGSRYPGRAYLGALGGAAAGSLLGVVVYEVLDRLAGDSDQLSALRRWVGLGFIGVGATLGYQWAGGGPRNGSPN